MVRITQRTISFALICVIFAFESVIHMWTADAQIISKSVMKKIATLTGVAVIARMTKKKKVEKVYVPKLVLPEIIKAATLKKALQSDYYIVWGEENPKYKYYKYLK